MQKANDGEGNSDAVTVRLAALEQEFRSLATLVVASAEAAGVIPSTEPVEEGTPVRVVDVPWRCERCKTLLGWCDTDIDQVRIRRSDLYVWANLGPGGSVSVSCRGCGHGSTVRYSPSAELQVDVADGEMVLTLAELVRLTEIAKESPRGLVILKVASLSTVG